MGYCGGTTADPTYHNIGDHTEALQVDFDPGVVSVHALLDVYWASHDPTRTHFSTQYKAAFWAADEEQRTLAKETGACAADAREGTLETEVLTFERFYRAEDYHQKYRLRRHPLLVDELIARFKTDQGMVDSTLAARLNGYLGGYGGRKKALAALNGWDLSPQAADLVRARVA